MINRFIYLAARLSSRLVAVAWWGRKMKVGKMVRGGAARRGERRQVATFGNILDYDEVSSRETLKHSL